MIRNFVVVVIILIALITYPLQIYRATKNCQAINEGRSQGEIRAVVLKQFLRDAASARLSSAKNETGLQRAIDLKAYKKYINLEKQIVILPERSCKI